MDFEALYAKTPATLEEIRTRVAYALERHPLCRSVQFDIVSMPRPSRETGPSACGRLPPMRCGRPPISSPTSRTPMILRLQPDFRLFPGYCRPFGLTAALTAARLSLN